MMQQDQLEISDNIYVEDVDTEQYGNYSDYPLPNEILENPEESPYH
jgi:hypothetical protein